MRVLVQIRRPDGVGETARERTEAWRGPDVALFYGVDPVTGEDVEVRTTDKPLLGVGDLHMLPSSVEEPLKLRLIGLFKMISKRQFDLLVDSIVDQAIAEIFTPDRMSTAFTENDVAQLSHMLASLFMAYRHRFPYLKQLDPVRVLGPVSNETPRSRRRRKKR